ncbi:ribonuclease P protein component [Candidatus Uhrbacteria bacterium CG_4_10_14_0_2_um_filter_41_7]|uniref:Ribonuclease P protein component n=1 Tax=Candidatus Uhrbacteria bacterium CG_4_9_14_3_um_filter_41_35 TaxID=1975034 RepID=A0A2M7XDD7_9BACT|nr:MAG: ribonuclease P protein component [Candidatus Uhrbacteria bacterium CG11_big_fil_rev_8_21_14_0_20_41_9]PIZ53409.1 MAG: ribonuclease P protein component [Candidatus Uhrbacteria bacterium CG_4_10_14_0_2_um_filter_41_7]PJA45901.1 MAG: ribonuclease P protein component [Candidatus Uhrbacteria bacterium CG_4_9_14_3_um_filter_41_35]
MLKLENRLKHEKDFDLVYKKGKSVFDKVAGVKFKPNNLEYSRFAIVVGLKVSKKAVERNRIKRQYREIIRLNLDKITPGYDIIVLTSKEVMTANYDGMQKGLLAVLKRAKLLA